MEVCSFGEIGLKRAIESKLKILNSKNNNF